MMNLFFRWENAVEHANRLALITGVRHQVRPIRDGGRRWLVTEVGSA